VQILAVANELLLDKLKQVCSAVLRGFGKQGFGTFVEEIRLEDRLHGRSEVVHARAGEFVGFVEGSL
jgi:hypothetical protein